MAPVALILALGALSLFGCKRLHYADTRPLDQAGMWYRSVEELRALDITDTEVVELAKVRQAGVSDTSCVALLRIARGRKQPFSSGDAIVNLRSVGVSEPTLLALAQLDQLGLWVGEAQAMRLAGLSDQILLAVARRRALGQSALSGPSLAQLKNAGLSEAEMLDLIQRGMTDEQAAAIVSEREGAAGGSGFVHYYRRRR